MNSERKPYKTYTKEFKVEAVRFLNTSDRPLKANSSVRH